MSQREDEEDWMYATRLMREMHADGANAGNVNDARDLWKRAACAAMSVMVSRNGEPVSILAKDFAYSAAHAADELVGEFRKRFVVGLEPAADPTKAYWPIGDLVTAYRVGVDPGAPEGDRSATFVPAAAAVPLGFSFKFDRHGLTIFSGPDRHYLIGWDEIKRMRVKFAPVSHGG